MSTDTKPFDWRVHLKVHPAADLFPLMSEAELQALADDLKRTGKLQHSIVLTEDGRLLDGRNRLDALAVRRSTTPVGVLSSHGSASH